MCTRSPEAKRQLDDYRRFHAECVKSAECLSKALVWKCDEGDYCGGLGDEVRGLAFTILAAMKARRPLFVKWHRMGQDMLDLFQGGAFDVRAPPSLDGCESSSIIDWPIERSPDLLEQAARSSGCNVWTTNMNLWKLWQHSVDRTFPSMRDIPTRSVVGCSMNFMFKPLVRTKADVANFAGLPSDYVAIHVRCNDKAMGADASEDARAEERSQVSRALDCARGRLHAKAAAVVSCSESAKRAALEVAKESYNDLPIFVSKDHARHIDHNHTVLNQEQFRGVLWSDFVVMSSANALDFTAPISGFARAAASIGFVPTDQLMRTDAAAPPCVPFEH